MFLSWKWLVKFWAISKYYFNCRSTFNRPTDYLGYYTKEVSALMTTAVSMRINQYVNPKVSLWFAKSQVNKTDWTSLDCGLLSKHSCLFPSGQRGNLVLLTCRIHVSTVLDTHVALYYLAIVKKVYKVYSGSAQHSLLESIWWRPKWDWKQFLWSLCSYRNGRELSHKTCLQIVWPVQTFELWVNQVVETLERPCGKTPGLNDPGISSLHQ